MQWPGKKKEQKKTWEKEKEKEKENVPSGTPMWTGRAKHMPRPSPKYAEPRGWRHI
jgi:hypothetical protein